MDYARQQRDPSKHMLGITVVILIHVLVVWALCMHGSEVRDV